jgi:lipid II:glycine glycyltransferase (peptidoglycan interpeptide bridge formation enzyme)
VRRALREGLAVQRRTDGAALDEFYRLHLHTRRHLGVPTQPRRFIRELEAVFAAGAGHVLTVTDAERMVAAAVFISGGEGVVYKYGCSDRAALGKRPNNLLFDEALRIACDEGFRWLNLGRTEPAHRSLREFKLSFGAIETPLVYSVLSDQEVPPARDERRLARLAAPVIRHSPQLIGRVIGAGVHRHMGQ